MALDALAMVELDSIARGYRVVDAMVKRAPITLLEANLVEPGRYLVLFAGGVAEVEESMDAAVELAEDHLLDRLLLPLVHPDIVPALRGHTVVRDPDTIGVIETRTVSSALGACDRALKDADVGLCGLRVATGLGGKAFFVVHGLQHDVEASIEAALGVLKPGGQLHSAELIPRPHPEFVAVLLRPAPFATPTTRATPTAPFAGGEG
ncbi:MAG: BMC domain-containing protein [Alphaproteobacteria bacterium]|nr:BMC domain-containing protein [Alphaproteobacteria bacterium]